MSVNVQAATAILERLKAHYPRLAENDQASKDWLNEIMLTPDPHAIAEWMVTEWAKDRAPRIADWVSARRTSVHQAVVAAPDRLEIEAPQRVAPEKVRGLLDRATRALGVARLDETRAPLVKHDREWTPLRHEGGGAGLAVRPLSYSEVYDEDGKPRVAEPPQD